MLNLEEDSTFIFYATFSTSIFFQQQENGDECYFAHSCCAMSYTLGPWIWQEHTKEWINHCPILLTNCSGDVYYVCYITWALFFNPHPFTIETVVPNNEGQTIGMWVLSTNFLAFALTYLLPFVVFTWGNFPFLCTVSASIETAAKLFSTTGLWSDSLPHTGQHVLRTYNLSQCKSLMTQN